MEKITDLLQLEKLKKDLEKVHNIDNKADAEYSRNHSRPQRSWLGSIVGASHKEKLAEEAYDEEKLKFRNAARFSTFPNTIEISPEIACFLYTTHMEFEKQYDKLGKQAGRNIPQAVIGSALALLFQSPSMGVGAAKSYSNMYSSMKEFNKLIEDREKTCGLILENYRLVEKQPGTYALELQKFIEYKVMEGYGRHYVTNTKKKVEYAGIDPSLDPKNLPQLPPVSRGGPGGPG